jgi:D-glycero-D-manno-heptose 1,7-bisphosphate phosphatase
MAGKAVFLDRDNTVIQDPGYLSDARGVKLLPGVELAMKSLVQAGYKLVIVTNQSGIARGLLTEEALEKIHAEMRRQLAEHGAHYDALYYCPYHPEGTVEQYARDSDLRKPQPGMLRKAARELDLDLSESWMVGDSARDIEAGQRAGCKTVRVRTRPGRHAPPGDEDVQADYTVRNLVDAARVILRSPHQEAQARRAAGEGPDAGAEAAKVIAEKQPVASEVGEGARLAQAGEVGPDDDAAVRREILRHVRQLARADQVEEFSLIKLVAAMVQVLALLTLGVAFIEMILDDVEHATLWVLMAIALQTMSLTLFLAVKRTR